MPDSAQARVVLCATSVCLLFTKEVINSLVSGIYAKRRFSEEYSEKGKKGYAFSLLKNGSSLFDDAEKEIGIFRRPKLYQDCNISKYSNI